MIRARRVASAGVIAIAGFANQAWAAVGSPETGGRFVLDARACPAVSEAAIRRIVAIEIGDLLIEPGARGTAESPADRLIVRCAGDIAELEAVSAAGAGRVARTLVLRDFPGDAAPRALALAGLEALAAQSPAVRARIQNQQVTRAAHVSPAPPSASDGPGETRNRIGLALVRCAFLTRNGAAAWGGRFEVGREIGAMWDLALDMEVGGAQTSLSIGEANALLFSLGGFAGIRTGGRRLVGVLGLGGRAGVARLAGDPSGAPGLQGNDVLRPWAGPAITGRLTGGGSRVGLTIFAEAGFAIRGADGLAGGQTVLAVSGGWATGGVGLRF